MQGYSGSDTGGGSSPSSGKSVPISADVTFEDGSGYTIKAEVPKISSPVNRVYITNDPSPTSLHSSYSAPKIQFATYQQPQEQCNPLSQCCEQQKQGSSPVPQMQHLSYQTVYQPRTQTAPARTRGSSLPAQALVRDTQYVPIPQSRETPYLQDVCQKGQRDGDENKPAQDKQMTSPPIAEKSYAQLAYVPQQVVQPVYLPGFYTNTMLSQMSRPQPPYKDESMSPCCSMYNSGSTAPYTSYYDSYEPTETKYITDKSIKEKIFLSELDKVDNKCAEGIGRLTHVPLPMLERLDCNTMPERRAKSLPRPPPPPPEECKLCGDCDVKCLVPDINGCIDNMRRCLANCCDEVKAVICPEKCCPDEICASDCCAVPAEPKCKYCGYTVKYCPECGYPQTDKIYTRYPEPMVAWKEVPGEESCKCLKDPCVCCKNFECTLFGNVGECVDKSLLSNKLGDFCREAGDCVDEAIADCIKSCTECCTSCLPRPPQMPRQQMEGYPLYEPDPYLARREKPTGATGNCCVDTLNALLDQCCVEPHEHVSDYADPKIPDTKKTGNWIVDKLNEVLDDCCYEPPPPPPPPPRPKKRCPTLDCKLDPLACCTEVPPPPPTPPPEATCALFNICKPRKPTCPTCHQQLRKPLKGAKKANASCCDCSGGDCDCGNCDCGGGGSSCGMCNCMTRSRTPVKKPGPPPLVYPFKPEKEPQTKCCLDCCPDQPKRERAYPTIIRQPAGFVAVPAAVFPEKYIHTRTSRSCCEPEMRYPEPIYTAHSSPPKADQVTYANPPTASRASLSYRTLSPTSRDIYSAEDSRRDEGNRTPRPETAVPSFQQLPTVYMPPDMTLSTRPSQRRENQYVGPQFMETVPIRVSAPRDSCLTSKCCSADSTMH